MASKPSMPLHLQHSIIRPWQPSDAPSLTSCANNHNVARFMGLEFPSSYTLSHAQKWISIASPLHYFANIHPTTVEVMGGFFIDPGNDVHYRSTEIGYYLISKKYILDRGL
jgi:hypothetical protein